MKVLLINNLEDGRVKAALSTDSISVMVPVSADWDQIDAGELEELTLDHILGNIRFSDLEKEFHGMVAKVAFNGTLTVKDLDINVIMHKHLDLPILNKVLFGNSNDLPKFSIVDIGFTVKFLESRNFKIITKRITENGYTVKAVRNP
jgi:hypothetical protein